MRMTRTSSHAPFQSLTLMIRRRRASLSSPLQGLTLKTGWRRRALRGPSAAVMRRFLSPRPGPVSQWPQRRCPQRQTDAAREGKSARAGCRCCQTPLSLLLRRFQRDVPRREMKPHRRGKRTRRRRRRRRAARSCCRRSLEESMHLQAIRLPLRPRPLSSRRTLRRHRRRDLRTQVRATSPRRKKTKSWWRKTTGPHDLRRRPPEPLPMLLPPLPKPRRATEWTTACGCRCATGSAATPTMRQATRQSHRRSALPCSPQRRGPRLRPRRFLRQL
jgi:hypothetical protein